MATIESLVNVEQFKKILSKHCDQLKSLQREYQDDPECKCADLSIQQYFNHENNALIDEIFQHWRFNLIKSILNLLPFQKKLAESNRYFDFQFIQDQKQYSCIFIDRATDLDEELFDLLYDKCKNYLKSRDLLKEDCLVVEFFADPSINMNWSNSATSDEDQAYSNHIKWISLDAFIETFFGIKSFTRRLCNFLSEFK